jgi:hypothetical protein
VDHFDAEEYASILHFSIQCFLIWLTDIYILLDCRYIRLVKKYGLDISQPGLEPDRGLTWQMTKRRGDREVHKWVE